MQLVPQHRQRDSAAGRQRPGSARRPQPRLTARLVEGRRPARRQMRSRSDSSGRRRLAPVGLGPTDDDRWSRGARWLQSRPEAHAHVHIENRPGGHDFPPAARERAYTFPPRAAASRRAHLTISRRLSGRRSACETIAPPGSTQGQPESNRAERRSRGKRQDCENQQRRPTCRSPSRRHIADDKMGEFLQLL